MYGENREYPQAAHLLSPVGVMIIGIVLAVTHHPLWWLVVAAFAGRVLYLVWLMHQRRRRRATQESTVTP
ncbi:hypothetical protein [Tessaracoccus massiliensis]|uniref:hypothetical protein n=1 Tax=Tessaracoccus massiliensis TaxID=1522311 RepID=UPI00058C4CBB|nr:hypothetical protein [Tessaracoccus massiliensis]